MKKMNRKILIIVLAAILVAAIIVTVVVVVCTSNKSDAAYTVTFDSNGGTAVDSLVDVAHNSRISEPSAPTRLGYVFDGWYKQKELADKWRFNRDRVTADITLYAKWNYAATLGLQMELKAGGTYTVTGIGSVTDNVIVVPSVHEGLPVTSIGREAFAQNGNITAVILPDSIVSIDSRAFYGCTALTEAELPRRVNAFGEFVFDGCKNLVKVNLPENMTLLPKHTFNGCHSLAAIQFPSTLKTISERAFYECRKLTDFTLPSALETIEINAFSGCHTLTSVNIPATVKNIGTRAFSNCVSIDTLTVAKGNINYYSEGNCVISFGKLIIGCKSSVIPQEVTVIGEGAFQGCKGLERIDSGDHVASLRGITAIEDYAFMGCSSLKNVIIPTSVVSIGDGAFDSCETLATVSFSDAEHSKLKTIGKEAFAHCAVTSIRLPASLTKIGVGAFLGDKINVSYLGTTDDWISGKIKVCSSGEEDVNVYDSNYYDGLCNVICEASDNATYLVRYLMKDE